MRNSATARRWPLHALYATFAALLQHLLTLGGTGIAPPFAQLIALLRRQLLETVEVLSN
jgi:hypothetical protein